MLIYGFGLNNYNDEEKDVLQEVYERLSVEDKEFYHNALPHVLSNVGIPIVSEETIPEIVLRDKEVPMLDWDKLAEKAEEAGCSVSEWLEDYLRKFIGFEANTEFWSFDEWAKHKHWNARYSSELKTVDEVRDLDANSTHRQRAYDEAINRMENDVPIKEDN